MILNIGKLSTSLKFLLLGLILCVPFFVGAQTNSSSPVAGKNSTSTSEEVRQKASTTASLISEKTPVTDVKDITKPEELPEKVAILTLFADRRVESPSIWSFMAYWVQQTVMLGVPANTIVLILLAPIISTIVAFVRVVVGLPTLELFVPIALAFAFVAVGLVLGMIILVSVILASYVARVILKQMSLMFFPKRSLSMLFLSVFVFAGLTLAVVFDIESVRNVSIFPVLILMLLGDSIVSVQLYKSLSETTVITLVTMVLGVMGFVLATSVIVQSSLILYPEIVFLTIPANFLIGSYFGLRLTEYLRFNSLV